MKTIKLFFWLIVFSIITAFLVGIGGIVLYFNGSIKIPNSLYASYLIGAFTMMTPTITKIFIKITTNYNGKQNQSPDYLTGFVDGLEKYKIEIDEYFKSKKKKSLKKNTKIANAVIFEANIHIFSFFYQTLALIALIIFASLKNAVSEMFLLIPFITIIIVFALMIKNTSKEYNKYFEPCNKKIIDKFKNKYCIKIFTFIAKNLPPLGSTITGGRAIVLVSNIYITIMAVLKMKG